MAKREPKSKELVLEVTPAVEEIANTGDEFIQQELTKFNIADATIACWKEQYGTLIISDPNNKEEYEILNQARVFVKKKRIEIEKVGKGLRTNAVKFQKAVLAEEKRLIELIDPLETYLEGEKERIDNIKLEQKRLRDEKEQIILQERAVKLIQMGMIFTGDAYTMEPDIRISVLAIKTSDQFTFDTLVAGVEKRFKDREAIRIENERLAEEAALNAKRIAEENLQKQEELRKKEEALALQQKAIEEEQQRQKHAAEKLIQEQQESEKKVKEERLKSRKSSLFALGFSQQNQRLSFKDLFFTEAEVANCTEEEWSVKLQITTENVSKIKIELEKQRQIEIEKAKQDAVEKERKRVEEENKAKALLEEEARLVEEKKKIAVELENARLAALLPNVDKVKTFLTQISKIPLPDCGESFKNYLAMLDTTRKEWLTDVYNKIPK